MIDRFITPISDENGLFNLTEVEKSYNYIHRKSRVIIEHFFGRMKTLFLITKKYPFYNREKLQIIIKDCFILTNIFNLYERPMRKL